MTTPIVGAVLAASLFPKHVPEFMRVPLMVHIGAGLLAIIAGFVALSAAKGATLHRKSGIVFVYAMVTMGLLASVVAASEPKLSSVLGGLFAGYLVVTALTTVRPPTEWSYQLDRGGMVLAFAFGVIYPAFGIAAYIRGNGTWDGVPAPVPIILGLIALSAGVGDLRMIRAGGLRGPKRLARHLWRMCFSMFIATGSFFLGQAKVIPKPIRIFPLLAILALAPLIAMAYWLWRIRVRRRLHGIVVAVTPAAEAA
jgi:uncharacterized membrane protein